MRRKSREINLLQELSLPKGKFSVVGIKGFKEYYGKESERVFDFIDLVDRRYKSTVFKIVKIDLKGQNVTVFYRLSGCKETYSFHWDLRSVPNANTARELIGYDIEAAWRKILRTPLEDEII